MEKIWLKHYPADVPAEIEKTNETLVDFLEDACKKYPNNRAFTSHGETLTFKKSHTYINNLAASLTKLGVQKGDRVAVILPNLSQYPISIFAILKIGAIVVNINPLYTENEMGYILQDSGAKVAIVLNMIAKNLNNLYGKNNLQHIIVTKVPDLYPFIKRAIMNFVIKYIKRTNTDYLYKAHSFKDMVLKESNLNLKNEVISSDIAFLQYTGATTGRPKGAMLLHSNIVANILQIKLWIKPWAPDLDKQIVIDALPLYHIFSLTANLFTFFFAGSENIMIPNPRDVQSTIEVLKKFPFTIFSALDTLYNHLLNSPEFTRNKYPYFKYSVAGGMVARESVANRWFKETNVMPSNCYGLTETSPAVTMNPFDNTFDNSVGFPIPSTEVEIRDQENGSLLPINSIGLIFVKGPQVMKGYWNNPEKTAHVLDKDGWFNTGDCGYLNELGKLFISGRQNDMIIVSGFNVYPVEVEQVLDKIPEVKEAVVVGSIYEPTGERVNAFVVLKPNMSITESEIIKKCKKDLANYKIPHRIFIINELPKTLVGKIDKKRLSDKLKELS